MKAFLERNQNQLPTFYNQKIYHSFQPGIAKKKLQFQPEIRLEIVRIFLKKKNK